jgi:hydrogenase-4 component B
VGLAAALFHTLNHAMFKGLLFLGAGAVQTAAGTRDLNRLGGLARSMPLTALAFGLGAAAISGLPPLNGFASEWLTFQGLLALCGAGEVAPAIRFAGYLAVGALALTAALAVACFVKATGMTFLAMPRTEGAATAR